MQLIGWFDRAALVVLFVFFVLGLFKGLIWQVSRVAILLTAYVVACRFGGELAALLGHGPAGGAQASPLPGTGAPPPGGVPEALPGSSPPLGGQEAAGLGTPDTTLYLAYVLIFVAVLVAMSLLAMLVQRLAAKAGLGFFDRVGGGVVGVATGAFVVLFGLSVVHMFFQGSPVAVAAESSHSQRLSQRAINLLGPTVPDDIRSVFALPPLVPPAQVEGAARKPAAAPGEAPPAVRRQSH